MTKTKFMIAPVGIALLLMATSAEADIRVTLTSGGTSVSRTQSGNAFFDAFTNIGAYSFTIQTAFSTLPGNNNGVSQLASTSIVGSTSGTGVLPNSLTILVEEVSGGALQTFTTSSPSNYSVLNSATVTSGLPTSLFLRGSSQFDASPDRQDVAPVVTGLSNSTAAAGNNSTTINGASSYILSHSYTLSEVQGGTTSLTVGFNTTITPLAGPGVAVPEPSSLVLTGLVAIGLGGFGLRRRLRARPKSIPTI